MKKPTPIDHSTLPWEQGKAVTCWRYNEHRASKGHTIDRPVEKVWATSHCLYHTDPSQGRDTSGSRSIGLLYATEDEAWEACIIAVQEQFDKRMKDLRGMADKAKQQQETPHDHD